MKLSVLIILICSAFIMNAQTKNIETNGKIIGDSSKIKQKRDSTFAKIIDSNLGKKVQNEIRIIGDTNRKYFSLNTKKQIPKRAALCSAVLPGLGQFYNKQYWKIGIMYAGIGYAGWRIDTTLREYNNYREAIVLRLDNNPNTKDAYDSIYSTSALGELKTKARQRMDRLVVYSAVWYAFGIVDALTSAHLKNFDVSKNISMQIYPMADSKYLGIGIVLKQ
jgi:Family of unknown function (DUF5683)